MDFKLKSDYIMLEVQLCIYNLDVLHKCFYWYGDTFSVDIEKTDKDTAIVKLYFSDFQIIKNQFDSLKKKIRSDLMDFKTRDIVTKETKNVRDLIIAKAFASFDE